MKQVINIGTNPNDFTGDPIRTAFDKTNQNFTELYSNVNSAVNWANSVSGSSNNWANAVGTSGNNYTNYVGTAGNNYTNYVGTSGNSYAVTSDATYAGYANSYATIVGTAGNNYTNYVGTSGNNYTVILTGYANNYGGLLANSSNNYAGYMANSANGIRATNDTAGNNYASYVGTSGNSFASYVGTSANAYASSLVTGSSNAWANTVGAAANANAVASYVKLTGRQTISNGFSITAYNAGLNVAAFGTWTPDPANGNYQFANSNGALTIAAPTSDCAIDVLLKNGMGRNNGAQSLALTGYNVASSYGDTYTNLANNQFILSIRRINGISTIVIKALQ